MSSSVSAAEKAKNDLVVKDGMLVSMDYTLKGTDGKLIDTNKGREPLKYVHGQKMMIPGLEKELTGMKVGGEKNVTVKPEDAYGPINKNAFQEVPERKTSSQWFESRRGIGGEESRGASRAHARP